jgi:23S rRNA (cytosine1962-C5)-methyltransferase
MILKLEKQDNYELIDSGNGEKLEKYGDFTFLRPDKEALFGKSLSEDVWSKTDLKFERDGVKTKWIIKNGVPKSWNITFGYFVFSIKPTSFKHIGLFPEQLLNWSWLEKIIKKENRKIRVINLFAYTGGATLACANAGAEVAHVDSSKNAVLWARENAKLSNLEDASIRWIIEDVLNFLKREVKRGNKYDGIIMDPPSFGHGPKDELWKIEENFLELMSLCKKILSDDPSFILVNGYTAGYSPIVYENNLKDLTKGLGGKIESGELAIEDKSGKLLPCGIFSRWSKN